MNGRLSKLIVVLTIALTLLVGLWLSLAVVSTSQAAENSTAWPAVTTPPLQNSLPESFPIITGATTQGSVSISGDCIAFRDDKGRVYLHNRTAGETVTVTDKEEPDGPRKVVISQGIVVWRSDRSGEQGLWGYYHPTCNDAGIFGSEVIGPFYIVSRANAHAPALAGEMVTFDTIKPAGVWYIALVELDANNNGIPDATEANYNPGDDSIIIRLSCCGVVPRGEFYQRLSDVYWDDTYQIACWSVTSTFDLPPELVCNDLHHYRELQPWTYQFTVSNDTNITPYTFQGIIAIHRDLVVWTGAPEFNLSGFDLYIADLDLDDDGILNPYDDHPGEGPTEFVLVNRPWHQQHPDIWWPFVVWTDGRNSRQQDIYAYDLSLDSDGDGIPNWKDPNRSCIDPAEIRVTSKPINESMPEIENGAAIWVEEGDIYGAHLQPVQPQPRVPVTGTPHDKAVHWLDRQTVHFSEINHVPGYIAATGMISHYKSFLPEEGDQEHVIQAWYSPRVGSYLVSFDFCYYGEPDQKRYLGRYGRGFTYDQALALIVHTMLAGQTEAQELGRYVSHFQNEGQLPTTPPGSFGFSFNGQGFWGEKDNFYDMDYLRGGANGWMGYGYLYYSRHYNDKEFLDVMTGIADYLLDLQVINPTEALTYGLFTGGHGSWVRRDDKDIFLQQDITWVSTEHNIDIYFFLRDLGQLTGDNRYIDAANRQRNNMHKLWNETKGRFDQGLNDSSDALDASSWGAMYWIAVGDLEKARRSLEYADQTYRRTMAVSNTVTISPEITIWGYKPYEGTVDGFDWTNVDLIWSEGSLGVAMANLKLGHALLDRCDPQGQIYIQKAKNIMAEMEKLQTLDPEGGIFYTAYPGPEITDFARAPSVAGTAWYLMVKKAIEDETLRNAFWGPDPSTPSVTGDHLIFLPIILSGACS